MNRKCGLDICTRCVAKYGKAAMEAAYTLGHGCPCVDHVEIDIGVGVQTGEHQHWCQEHGQFATLLTSSYEIEQVFRDNKEEDKEEDKDGQGITVVR